MGTGVLAIALRPELVALITGSADSAPYGTGSPGSSRCRAVGVLPMLGLGARPRKVRVVDAYVLLKLLEGVVRALREGVQAACVEVAARHMAVRHERCRRHGVVGGEPV